ncbi:MAG: citrate synthase family protein [Acidobacteriota bacterium]
MNKDDLDQNDTDIGDIDGSISLDGDERFLDARQAAERLGISRSTLYAYASRGLLRSEPIPGRPRSRRYPRADVERLVLRREVRRDPQTAAPKALDWGTPVLDSAISLIDRGRLYYRGHDVVELARQRSAEEVAALIWCQRFDAASDLFDRSSRRVPRLPRAARDLEILARCQMILPLAAAADPAAHDLRPESVAATAARLLRTLVQVAASARRRDSLAATLASGWKTERVEALDSALVLCADHELNVSAFTARCVASAHATPYEVVGAGLAALAGQRHGGEIRRVDALFREAGDAAGARRALGERLQRGEALPGFLHPLYPAGDPRGRALIELALPLASPEVADLSTAIVAAGEELVGGRPTLDVGLVVLARALSLPPGAAIALFALGRTIGWIGHALEQYALEPMIRPRARYVGVAPAHGPPPSL